MSIANWARYGALAAGLGLLFFYSLYHVAVYYRAHRLAQDLREAVQKQEIQLAALEAENRALRTRSQFLAPDAVDLDYLELMARQHLRYARESEVIRVLRVDEMP